jgi:hypothetical protein
MKKFIIRNWEFCVLITILLCVVVINSSSWNVFMGLDNASPYFFPTEIIHKMDGNGVIAYGGLIFTVPFFSILHWVGFSPELLSQLYYFGCMILGVLGMFYLGKHFRSQTLGLVIAIFYLFSLFGLWIFSQPNFLFLASFSTIPWLIYILTFIKNLSNELSVLFGIFFLLLTLLFLSTSLNLVAFFAYIFQVVIVGVIVRIAVSNEKNSRIISGFYDPIIIWPIFVVSVWFLSMQVITLVNGGEFFGVVIVESIRKLGTDGVQSEISESLLTAESGNSLLDALRYSTGWMDLRNIHDQRVFEFSDKYSRITPISFMISLPVWLSMATPFLFYLYNNKKKYQKFLGFYVLLFLGVFLMSKYGVFIIGHIPVISSMFRWVSSKLWVIVVIPLLITAGLGFDLLLSILKDKFYKYSNIIKFVCLVLILVIIIWGGYPIVNGSLINRYSKVSIPDEYFQLRNYVDREDKILYLPQPQNLYFRQYDWGYYGSDFLTYLVPADVVDVANVICYGETYFDYVDSAGSCEFIDLDFVLYDESLTDFDDIYSHLMIDCGESNLILVYENNYYQLYKVVNHE